MRSEMTGYSIVRQMETGSTFPVPERLPVIDPWIVVIFKHWRQNGFGVAVKAIKNRYPPCCPAKSQTATHHSTRIADPPAELLFGGSGSETETARLFSRIQLSNSRYPKGVGQVRGLMAYRCQLPCICQPITNLDNVCH